MFISGCSCTDIKDRNANYKLLVRIFNSGKARWYVDSSYFSQEELDKVNDVIGGIRVAYLEEWKRVSDDSKLYKLLDLVPDIKFSDVVERIKNLSHCEKIAYLEKHYL